MTTLNLSPADRNMANIKVAVRVRPISARELNLTGSEVVVRTGSNEISLTNLKVSSSKAGDSRERTRRYGFDYCFDSSDPEAKNYATQAAIYETLGRSILDAIFLGYNSCLVAYGQSASGKTYTMMGTKEDPGLVPRLCEGLFSRVEKQAEYERIYHVTVSYLEIYNERVRDLLKPSTSASGLRVREHPRLGPYVQGLTHHVVRNLGSLMSYVEEGTKARKTASTFQNPSSSRSHALLTVALSQETANGEHPAGGVSSSRRQDTAPRGGSRLHLVDLAGSESAATCGGVHRLKEGANINKSLVALGNVISALAERGSTGSRPGRRRYIPYRDSSLTWLLKDALGGNATTIMLATISPASGSYNETAHTLRFAQRAQSVVNRPVVNEDPVARLIRELRDEVARLKSLLLEKNIDQQTKVPCCCGKVQSSKDSATDPQYRERQETLDTSRLSKKSNSKDDSARSKDERCLDLQPIRRFNSSDSVTIYETGSSGFIRKFSSYESLQSSDRFVRNYNQAKVTELNDEDDEVVDEINEPVFVDIPTLVAVLIKPDDSLQESSTQIEEICSDEVQEDSIDADFIASGNEDFEGPEKVSDIDQDDRRNSLSSCTALGDSEIGESQRTSSECPSLSSPLAEKSRSRGKFSKQNSVDVPSSNLNVSRKFGSIEGISKRKEPILSLQRSHTNLERRPTLSERGKKLNNIREIDDRKAAAKSESIWKAIGNIGSKDHLQRKSSNDSDKSLKDSNGKINFNNSNNIGRKPSLENLRRKTSKDSSSSSSKEEQILISNLTRDKLSRRKSSLDQETIGDVRPHTAIQRVKRAEIVAAVTERLYSSRKQVEETNMATNNASDMRSPPEGTDVKVPSISGFAARSKLQEISRKMLLKRRRITVETQTEAASTLRFKDTASLTDEPKIILQDAAVLTEDHADCEAFAAADYRTPVLRVKDMATLTDRPRIDILRCKDAESSTNDLDFDDELHSLRNDSGILSDDTQNYAESNLSSTEVSEFYSEGERKAPCADSSTNTYFSSPAKNSAVQTMVRPKSRRKDVGCGQCCNLVHESSQHTSGNSPEKNVISISVPDMISITIESTNGLESKIALMDGGDSAEDKSKPILNNKESQTDEQIKHEIAGSFIKDSSVRSTATQADGRVFRIENIFQDPRSKSCSDVVSDLKIESATKKSVTFRNSLGTSSIVETENGTEMEWDRMYLADVCQKKRPTLKGRLTRTFINRRRSYSLSPRRPAHRLTRFDLWKNWTFPCPEKSPDFAGCSREAVDTSFATDAFCQDADLRLINNEYIFVDKTLKETTHESPDQLINNFKDFKDLTKSKSLVNGVSDYDHNFSEDSLDYDEDNEKSTDAKTTDDRKNYESLCPPDVVAHTKKEISRSANHAEPVKVESSVDDDFESTEVEFPKKKPSEMSNKDSIHDYKSLILGTPSYVIDSDSEEETNVRMSNISDSKKKVSFSNPSSPEEIDDEITASRKILTSRQHPEVALKSIIKKARKKLAVDASFQSSINADQFLQQKQIKPTKNEDNLRASKENRYSEDSEESVNDKKVDISNESYVEKLCSESDSVSDEDTGFHTVSKRNLLKEYLNEAMIFMRNMNSINEYMSATNMLGNYAKCTKRKERHGNNLVKDKNYVKFRGRKVSLKDDTDKYLQSDKNEVVSDESYEKCLRSIERLEACINEANEHNQVLRDKYGIDIESAGAKSSLASPSIDFKVSAVTKDNVIRPCENVISENDVASYRSSPSRTFSLSSTETDNAEQSSLNEREKHEVVIKTDKHDLDDRSNSVTSEDDLERRIFDQLMNAVDSSRYWYLRKARQRRLWKMSDFRSRSPTTYSKFRETFRQDARRIPNFDKVSVAVDYLRDTRGIESSSQDFTKTLSGQAEDIGSRTPTESTFGSVERCNRNKLSVENSSLLKSEVLNEPTTFEIKGEYLDRVTGDPVNSIEAGQAYEKDEIASKNAISKDSLKIDSMNHRFGGSLNVELKYLGSPRAKFLELLRERRRIVENSRGTNAF